MAKKAKQYVEIHEGGKITKVEMSPQMEQTWKEMRELAKKVQWCHCSPDDQKPQQYSYPGGGHGWECGRCGGLIQTG